MELAGVAAAMANRAPNLVVLAVQDPDHVVATVANEQIALLRVRRERIDGHATGLTHQPVVREWFRPRRIDEVPRHAAVGLKNGDRGEEGKAHASHVSVV